MEVEYLPGFIKDFNKIKTRKDQLSIHTICFETIPLVRNLTDIDNIKKIKGYSDYYRIRKGNYRIGIKYENGKITFMRVLHRRDIYRYFP